MYQLEERTIQKNRRKKKHVDGESEFDHRYEVIKLWLSFLGSKSIFI